MKKEVEAKTGFTKSLVNPPGELSISDAISNIIAPYSDAAQDFQAFKKLVTLACVAWNATILPVEDRAGMLDEMRKTIRDQELREDFSEAIAELIARKNKLYPHVNRMIVQFKVTNRKNDFHIAIASTSEYKETPD